MFGGAPPLFQFMFLLVAAVIVFSIARGLFTAVSNLGEPLVDRPAMVVGKRQSTSVSGGMNNMPATSTDHYHVTFQLADGSREEFSVNGRDYGMLAEGDQGVLHTQGTWFKGFDRTVA